MLSLMLFLLCYPLVFLFLDSVKFSVVLSLDLPPSCHPLIFLSLDFSHALLFQSYGARFSNSSSHMPSPIFQLSPWSLALFDF